MFRFVLIDSPYNITFYSQDSHWCKDEFYSDKSIWSGTIIQPFNKGNLYGKTALELNRDQLINEIINQFMESNVLKDIVYKENNFNLTKDLIEFSSVSMNGNLKGRLESSRKKWVNNVLNEEYRQKIIQNIIIYM